jgi:hypothetical protein
MVRHQIGRISGPHVSADGLDGGHQHGGIVGESKQRYEVRDGIDRHHEIGERSEQDRLGLGRGRAVRGAVEGCHGILGEGDAGDRGAQLAPESLADQPLVLLHPGAAGGIRSASCSHG